MPYRWRKVYRGKELVTYSRDVVKQQRLGYTEIPIHRPTFFYFEFQGLRPNIPHWIFFGNKELTRYCNTTYDLATFNAAARTSKLREPGDSYVTATGFPTEQGGPTNSATNIDDAYLTSQPDGSLSGLFYLQSNTDLHFPTTMDGTYFIAIDLSVINRDEALSYSAAKFYGMGQYEEWYQYTTKESYQKWEKQYDMIYEHYDRRGSSSGGSTSSSSQSQSNTIGGFSIGYSYGGTAQVDPGLAGAAGLGPVGGYSGITGPNSANSGLGHRGGVSQVM